MLAFKTSKISHKLGRSLTIFVLSLGLLRATPATEFLDIPDSYLQPKQCSFNLIGTEDMETDLPVRLTSGWSQEGVGVPEVREFLKEKQIELRWVGVGLLDDMYDIPRLVEVIDQPESVLSSLESLEDSSDSLNSSEASEWPTHGNRVAAVIAGREFGMTQNAYFSALLSGLSGLKPTYLAADSKPIEIVNRSLGVSPDTHPVLEELVQKNGGRPFLLVNSAGNEYIFNLLERGTHTTYFESTPALIVSAIGPTGRINSNSGGGPQVVIGAPTYGPGLLHPKEYQQTLDGGWNFSGTSAAAPMVTGALVGVLGLLEGLNYQEARELLIKTSFLTKSFKKGHNFGGYGVLNYYKLMRVAHRLYQKGWPQSRNLIFQSGPGSVYDFTIEAARNFEEAENLITSFKEGYCKSKLTLLKLLRTSFFLDSSRTETRQALFALYANEGYHDQAIYFSPLGFEYYGSGMFTSYDLQRELLNSMSTGNYEGAFSVLRRGSSYTEDIFSPPVLSTVASYIADHPHPKRRQFIELVRESLTRKAREVFTELLRVRAKEVLTKELIFELIEAGVEFEKEYANSLLYECVVRNCDIPTMILLVDQGANANQVANGRGLLAIAAYGGDVNAVRFLMNNGAEVNHQDWRGYTALTYAIIKQHTNIVRLLLKRGAKISPDDTYQATQSGNPDLLTLLKKYAVPFPGSKASS